MTRGLIRGQVHGLWNAGTAVGLTDGQLLERFATRRDEGSEAAFAALVGRHGPMVLRVCRGVLGDDHEAMDAFQATFLVLARKGGSLWVRDSVGPWLHRVACRAAGRAKSAAARRRAAESMAATLAAARTGGGDREEFSSVIHEEVDRLPERFRVAVVLCDLEGRTREQAARHLGCPVGTVASRLARGRQRLRDRLRRLGLDPGDGPLTDHTPRVSIPPGLVGPTAVAAARFFSTGAALPGAAAPLALEVLRSMTMNGWFKVATVLLALGASTSGVVSFAAGDVGVVGAWPDDTPKAASAPAGGGGFYKVEPGRLSSVVKVRGGLEASENADVYSPIEGETKIVSILPGATPVTKGQLICELDSSALKDRLANQVIVTKAAVDDYQKAKFTREVVEAAAKESSEGVFPEDVPTALGEIALAESNHKRVEDRVEWATKMLSKGYVPQRQNQTEELSPQRMRFNEELARTKKVMLEKYTKDQAVKGIKGEVHKARDVETAKRTAFNLERTKEERISRQISECRLIAPTDGVMFYARDRDLPGNRRFLPIRKGATVRERQRIVSVANPDSPMLVAAKVPKPFADEIKRGLPARVQVDAFPVETFPGVVQIVAPVPDPPTDAHADIEFYTHVTITKADPRLQIGMIASVEIVVFDLDNVLRVPVSAILRDDGKPHAAVKTPDGRVDWREVTLGVTDGKMVEVKAGLTGGEDVALSPALLLKEGQKRKVENPTTKPNARREAPGDDAP